jgi:hypothetical protein
MHKVHGSHEIGDVLLLNQEYFSYHVRLKRKLKVHVYNLNLNINNEQEDFVRKDYYELKHTELTLVCHQSK